MMRRLIILIEKQVIQGIRDVRTILIMLGMPLLFIGILNLSFSNMEPMSEKLDAVSLKYAVEESVWHTNASYLVEGLKSVYDQVTPFERATYHPYEDIILRFDQEGALSIYYNNTLKQDALDLVRFINLLKEKTDAYTTSTISKHLLYPTQRDGIIQYYGITLITLTVMFGSVTGAYSMIKERTDKTFKQLESVGLSTRNIVMGKWIGSGLLLILEILCIMALSHRIYGINWGVYPLMPLLILSSQGLFAISLGLMMGYRLKDTKSAWLILLGMIMFWGYLGGAFIPLGQMKQLSLYPLTFLSPLTYTNTALFSSIYEKEYRLGWILILIQSIISFILLWRTSYELEVRR